MLGSYLLGDEFEHTLDAQAAGVIAAAFSITLAAILLYFLLKPRRALRSRNVRFRRAG
jgi:peptidoglycan/LPS O-acetylase OafA/YrhL